MKSYNIQLKVSILSKQLDGNSTYKTRLLTQIMKIYWLQPEASILSKLSNGK